MGVRPEEDRSCKTWRHTGNVVVLYDLARFVLPAQKLPSLLVSSKSSDAVLNL